MIVIIILAIIMRQNNFRFFRESLVTFCKCKAMLAMKNKLCDLSKDIPTFFMNDRIIFVAQPEDVSHTYSSSETTVIRQKTKEA